MALERITGDKAQTDTIDLPLNQQSTFVNMATEKPRLSFVYEEAPPDIML